MNFLNFVKLSVPQFPTFYRIMRISLVIQTVKNLSAIQETQVQSLDWEDPLQKRMATHPSILPWRIPWIEDPGELQSMGFKRIGHE